MAILHKAKAKTVASKQEAWGDSYTVEVPFTGDDNPNFFNRLARALAQQGLTYVRHLPAQGTAHCAMKEVRWTSATGGVVVLDQWYPIGD